MILFICNIQNRQIVEQRLPGTWGGEEMGSYYLMGTKFLIGMVKNLWR